MIRVRGFRMNQSPGLSTGGLRASPTGLAPVCTDMGPAPRRSNTVTLKASEDRNGGFPHLSHFGAQPHDYKPRK